MRPFALSKRKSRSRRKIGPEKRGGEGLEEVGAVVAGADDGAAPEADAFDDAGAW